MADYSAVVDDVSSVISRCVERSRSEDLSDLDLILTSLLSSSTQLGVYTSRLEIYSALQEVPGNSVFSHFWS